MKVRRYAGMWLSRRPGQDGSLGLIVCVGGVQMAESRGRPRLVGQNTRNFLVEMFCFKVDRCPKKTSRGAPKGRARGAAPPPWDLKNAIFSGFLPLNYVIYIFEVCFLCFLLCGRTEEACSMVNSLRKVDFSHPTGHYTWKNPPP